MHDGATRLTLHNALMGGDGRLTVNMRCSDGMVVEAFGEAPGFNHVPHDVDASGITVNEHR